MRIKIISLFLVLAVATTLTAQDLTPIPFIQNQWFKSNGTVAAGYKLCTYYAGTTSPLSTYSTSSSGGPLNTNPVTLDSAGRANVFLQAYSYKFILYASGTGNTCNGNAVGALIWSEDNIAGYAIALNTSIVLPKANGGTGNTVGVRNDQAFGATGDPGCSAGGGTNSYLNVGGGAIATSVNAAIVYTVSTPATVSNLRAIVRGAVVPASESAVFTLRINGADTALTCTVAAAGTVCSNTTDSFSAVAGDFIDFKLNCSGGVTSLTGSIGASVRLSQ